MRKLITITFIFALMFAAISVMNFSGAKKLGGTEKFNVITVQGRILFKTSGVEMKRGDVYISGTRLDFLSNGSRAAIVNKSKGRFVLTGSTKGKIKVLPAVNNMSTRKGALLNVVDLKKHFSDRYLILKQSEVQIGRSAYPMDNENFFYLTFKHKGEKIAKKLKHEGDFLILDKHEIFKIDNKEIPYEEKEMTLFYRKDGKGSKINTFTPVFADVDVLKEEVGVLLEAIKDKTNQQKVNEVTAYMVDFYGTPHKSNLDAWLKAEFGLE